MTRYRKIVTSERLKEVLSLDRATGILRWKVQLSSRGLIGSIAGCIDSKGYRNIGIDGQIYYAHVLVWFIIKGKWPSNNIDHRNHNTDDNRFENLRLASEAQNQWNSKPHKNNTSGQRGVYELRGKWMVLLAKNGKRHYLGIYNDHAAARAVAVEGIQRLHGEFGA